MLIVEYLNLYHDEYIKFLKKLLKKYKIFQVSKCE